MNDFYTTNMLLLKEYDMNLYNKCVKTELSKYVKYILKESRTKEINLFIEDGNKKYWLHNNNDPQFMAKEFADSIKINDNVSNVLIIWGLGFAYEIDYILNRFTNTKIFVIEPDINIFIFALYAINMKKYFETKNLKIIVNNDPEEIFRQITKWLEVWYNNEYFFRVLPGYLGKYNSLIDSFYSIFLEQLKVKRLNMLTEEWFNEKWLLNFLNNLPLLIEKPKFSEISQVLRGVPALIVGAGPSLSDDIEKIKKIKGKAIIICAGSTYSVLRKNGIEPDILVAIDGNDENEAIFEGIEDFEGIAIISSQFNYKVTKKIKNIIFFSMTSDVYSQWIFNKLQIEEPTLISGPSVSNLALDIANRLNMNPIVLIGQDLCYTDNKLHAEGHTHNKSIQNEIYNLIKYKDRDGNEVYTREAFLVMKKYFELYKELYANEKILINSTSKGLKIEGYINLSLEEVIKKILINDNSQKIIQLKNEYQKSNTIYNETKKFNDVKKLFEKILKESEQLILICEKALNIIENNNKNEIKIDELYKLENKLTDYFSFKEFYFIGINTKLTAINMEVRTNLSKIDMDNLKGDFILKSYKKEFKLIKNYIQYVNEKIINMQYLMGRNY